MNWRQKYISLYVRSLLRLVRWPNLIMVFFTQLVVVSFIVKNKDVSYTLLAPLRFYFLAVGTLLIAAAGYIINDYYDIKIDLVNKPQRIEIGRIISRRQALFLHSFFNFTAIFLGLLLSWRVALYFAASAFVLWLYSNYLKRQPLIGNLTVSLLTAATIWIISLYFKGNDALLYIYSLFAFWLSLIREIIKDMEDVKGDATYGCKTIPILWGSRKTKWLLYAILCILIVQLALFAHTSVSFSHRALTYLLVLPLAYLGYKLMKADKQKDYTSLSRFCKWIMLFGVFSLGMA